MSRTVRKKRHILRKILIVSVILLIIILGIGYAAVKYFKVKQISFEGTDRSLKLGYDLKHGYEKAVIPFIETYEIKIEYPDKVDIVLYEKSIVAYIIYKGNYMYFDKDGIVVETSKQQVLDVPLVDGLGFDSVVLYNPLPVEDEKVFNTILDLSQNLQKYDLAVDKIHFNDDLSIVLYIGNVRVNFGKGEYLSEKLHELKQMEGAEYITFKKDIK